MFGFCISFNVWSFIEILDIFLLLGQECHQETVLLQFFLIKIMADLVSSRLMI